MKGYFNFYQTLEIKLLESVQSSCELEICLRFFRFLTDIHKIVLVQIIVLFLLGTLIVFKKNIRWIIVWGIFWIALGDGIGGVVKKWIDRPRPGEAGVLVDERCPQAGGGSMPSNHSLNSFATWAYYKPLMGRWSPLFLIAAMGSAYLRVWCGVHYVSDVLVGALVGIIWGFWGWHLRRKLLLLVERVF